MYQWKIWTKGATIYQEYGTVDGEKSETKKTVKGKNIGKANETTPSQQAESEAKALWQKKKDTKYSETSSAAEETVFLPMLAHDFKKSKKGLEYPVDVQPKFNGVRCMAFWMGDRLVLMSRGGKEWNVPHIVEELTKVLPKDYVIDGELYVHGLPLQDIVHLVKNPGTEEQLQVEFFVFDGFAVGCHEATWVMREQTLMNWIGSFDGQKIFPVETAMCESDEELHSLLQSYEEQGYEGVIVRLYDFPYELGHRSRGLWKLKNFYDQEFEIVGFTSATGNDKGTVVWECKTPNGGTFTVRPKGTREMRAKWYAHGKDYIGKKLTVKYQELTNDGIPEFPVGICVRDDGM